MGGVTGAGTTAEAASEAGLGGEVRGYNGGGSLGIKKCCSMRSITFLT